VNQLQTRAIVLSRTDYGEADRIITVLTQHYGKLSLMARGVRRIKSKLAGGIELFSVAEISYINGRGQIGTLTSARLVHYYASIVQSIDRVQLGYELIKQLHRATEDQLEPEYFELLEAAFAALDTATISTDLIRLWFQAQLLRYAGHSPNLKTDTAGNKLVAAQLYSFDFETVAFVVYPEGHFTSDHIKFLRLVFSGNSPQVLDHISGLNNLLPDCLPLVQTMLQTYIRI
jgi:DNA repair protein RecO (recombination protein O)